MSTNVAWDPKNFDALVALASSHWKEGGLVALPCEWGHEVAALLAHAGAAARLAELAGELRPAILLSDAAHGREWLPSLRGAGRRLLERLPPGPWHLRASGGVDEGLARQLDPAVRRRLAPEGVLTVRLPADPLTRELVRTTGLPLASVPWTEDAGEVLRWESAQGPAGEGGPTLIEAQGQTARVLREGALAGGEVEDQALCRVLFVCTGNTCRSPMAAALFGQMLAARLGVPREHLPRHGFLVQSAGLSAMMGDTASSGARETAAALGADLSDHLSQPLTLELFVRATHVFAMTRAHQAALVRAQLPWAPEVHLLAPDGEDVLDPIGGALEVYRECATGILKYLQQRLPEVLES